MKIVYLHQYFNTPRMPGGTRSYEMARRLVAAGHVVHMITSYTRADAPSDDWWSTSEDGINVHWLAVPYSNHFGFRGRINAFIRFAWAAARKAAQLDADVIFATSTPLTIAIPAIYASRRRGVPMVFEVRDLWPEAPIQLGALRNPAAIRLARMLEHAAYRHAAHVIGLSPGMVAGIRRAGVPAERVSMIPNSSDLDLFHPAVDGRPARERLGLGNDFTLAYFGTIGQANGLDFVLDGAVELKRRGVDDIRIVLHGDGSERGALMQRAGREGLDNVVFSPPVADKREIAQLARAADVCMTIYKDVEILYTCSPNKMFDALAAGRPVLTNMPGWLQSIVEDNRCGVFVQPGNAADFADKVMHLRDHPALRREFELNARALAERTFARDLLAAQLEAILVSAAKARSGQRNAAPDATLLPPTGSV